MFTRTQNPPAQYMSCLLFLLSCLFTSIVFADQKAPLKPSIEDMPLEELLNVKISTVSRKTQKLSDTPAAAFVISQEDIRRSSANSIPELLRMAPAYQSRVLMQTNGRSLHAALAVALLTISW